MSVNPLLSIKFGGNRCISDGLISKKSQYGNFPQIFDEVFIGCWLLQIWTGSLGGATILADMMECAHDFPCKDNV